MRRSLVSVFAGISVLAIGSVAVAGEGKYHAHLSGRNEVPARLTDAAGNAVFTLSDDGTELGYRLMVEDITNVVQAHIHVGLPSANGPVVAFLYGPVPAAGGPIDGRIATGTIVAADLIGLLAGHPLSDLVAVIEAGNAYVNVHTDDGVAPANTGAGDFPGGEIRGQMG